MPDEIKRQLGQARKEAQPFWSAVLNNFLPALRSGDKSKARRHKRIDETALNHRSSLPPIAKVNDAIRKSHLRRGLARGERAG